MNEIETPDEQAAGQVAWLMWLTPHSKLPSLGDAFHAGWAAGRAWERERASEERKSMNEIEGQAPEPLVDVPDEMHGVNSAMERIWHARYCRNCGKRRADCECLFP